MIDMVSCMWLRPQNNRLCVVEAKCIGLDKDGSRRAKVLEQTSSYAVFLSQEVHYCYYYCCYYCYYRCSEQDTPEH